MAAGSLEAGLEARLVMLAGIRSWLVEAYWSELNWSERTNSQRVLIGAVADACGTGRRLSQPGTLAALIQVSDAQCSAKQNGRPAPRL